LSQIYLWFDTKLQNLRKLAVWSPGVRVEVAKFPLPYDFRSMRHPFFARSFLVVCASAPLWAQAVPDNFLRVGEVRRSEVRDAVAAHRAAQREEVRREEAVAGRRLTAAELYELRQQVRGQWTPPATGALVNSAESQPAERIAPAPPTAARPLTPPSSQRR